MEIEDEDRAYFYLKHLNYYRLRAYWLPFEQDSKLHFFRDGTTFESVLSLYVFDRNLRLLFLDAIERIEVAIRSVWSYQTGHRHGAKGYRNPALFRSQDVFEKNLQSVDREVRRSGETFVHHFRTEYGEEEMPIWAVCEILSLGTLSKIYKTYGPAATRKVIAREFQTSPILLASWLEHFSYVRNICAHHSRLRNRLMVVKLEIPKKIPPILVGAIPSNRHVYASAALVCFFLDIIAPDHSWKSRLVDLIGNDQWRLNQMGFPANWKALPIWQGAS
jgi:abortive infection bacteriophage resistance protein